MIIVKEKIEQKEAKNDDVWWDITWKDALKVFNMLSGRRDVKIYDLNLERSPLGDQPILGFKVSGNDLFICGSRTGYVVFGIHIDHVVRSRHDIFGYEYMEIYFKSSKRDELKITWKSR
jgi:hypothetical protein